MNDNVLLIGAGGHASVLLEMLNMQNFNVLGYVSPLPADNKELFESLEWFKNDNDIFQFDKSKTKLLNGVGSMPWNSRRSDLYRRYRGLGYEFLTLISTESSVSIYASLEEGVQIMRGAIIQTGVSVGCNSIVNTGAIIDHNSRIGRDNHVAPGVTISGEVTSKENVHFGTGSSVIQSISIGENVVVGAGASITKDLERNTIFYPARGFRKAIKLE
ncbi:acetyltransferase [Pseudomonadales bacterium]|nr:acetyltransferase [Pseudomonadales bacterium]